MEGKITFWWLVFFFLCLCSSFFALSRPLKLLSSLALVFVSCLLNFWIFNVCKKGLKNVLGLNPFFTLLSLFGVELLRSSKRLWDDECISRWLLRGIQTLEDSWIRLEYFFRHLSICLSLQSLTNSLTDFFLCNWCNKKRAVFHGEEDKLFNSSSMSSECIV